MDPSPSVAAIVVAGGNSRRMGFDKLRADLAGLPVYLHSLQTLQDCPEIAQIILVASEKNLADFRSETAHISKLTDVLAGGSERPFSVAAGLEKVAPDLPFIAVHDAARPLLSEHDLAAVLAAAKKYGAACLAAPVTDTLKRADADHFITEAIRREQVWGMQTPQVFRSEILLAAYRSALAAGEIVTDEASAVANSGVPVKLIPPRDLNFKITYSCDIDLARAALASRASAKK